MRRMPDVKYPLRLRLRAARVLADLDQTEVAELMGDGYARSTISNMESGERKKIGPAEVIKWSRVTGVPLEFFTLDIDALKSDALPADPYDALEELEKRIDDARRKGVA